MTRIVGGGLGKVGSFSGVVSFLNWCCSLSEWVGYIFFLKGWGISFLIAGVGLGKVWELIWARILSESCWYWQIWCIYKQLKYTRHSFWLKYFKYWPETNEMSQLEKSLRLLYFPCMNIYILSEVQMSAKVQLWNTGQSPFIISKPSRTQRGRRTTIIIVWCSTVLFVKVTNKTRGSIYANNAVIYRAKTQGCARNYDLLLHDRDIFTRHILSPVWITSVWGDRESRHNLYCLMWKGSACNSLALIFKALISRMSRRLRARRLCTSHWKQSSNFRISGMASK